MSDDIQGALEDLEAGGVGGKQKSIPILCDMATQTEKNAWQVRNEGAVERIKGEIARYRNADEIQDLLDKNWPKEVYKVVKEVEGNPVWDDVELNLATFNAQGDNLEKGINRQIAKRYPDLVALLEEDRQDEDVICLEYMAKLHSKGGEAKNRRRVVMMVKAKDDILNDHKTITMWKNKLVDMQIDRIAVPVSEEGWERRKKMIEHVFWGEQITVMAYHSKGKGRKQDKKGQPPRLIKDSSNTEEDPGGGGAVVVSAPGKTYVDILKRVKTSIDMEKIGVKIIKASSTRTGDLLLSIEGKNPEGAQALKHAILNHVGEEQGVVVRDGKRDGAILHVKGLDATTTVEEVLNEVAAAAGEAKNEFRISALRPAFGDTQNATISASKRTINKLLDIGYLQIGWARCQLVERAGIKRCPKCWEVGHTTRNCSKEVDRRKACLRCAQEGHFAKNCRGEPYCPVCCKNGHRADSMGCPAYREAMGKQIKNRPVRHQTRPSKVNEDIRKNRTSVVEMPSRAEEAKEREDIVLDSTDPQVAKVNVVLERYDSYL